MKTHGSRAAIVFVLVTVYLSFTALLAVRMLFSLYALELGASPFEVGLLAATQQLVPLFLSLAIGSLADRYGARWLYAGGTGAASLSLLLPYFFPGLPALFTAALFCGLSQVCTSVLTLSLVGMLSAPEQLARNFSNHSQTTSLTAVSGPLLGGFVAQHFGYGLACVVLVPLGLAVVLMLTLGGGMLPRGQRASAAAQAREKFWNRELWRLVLICGVVQLAMDLYPFYLPIYAHSLGLAPSVIGLIVACAFIGAFVVRGLLPRLVKRIDEERLLGYSLAIAALGFALLPLFSTTPALMAVTLLYGVGVAAGAPITYMLVFKRTPPGQTGRAMGLRLTGNSAVRTAGPPVLGALAALLGVASAFFGIAALLGAVGFALWHGARHARPATA